jgi:hypothetical protein
MVSKGVGGTLLRSQGAKIADFRAFGMSNQRPGDGFCALQRARRVADTLARVQIGTITLVVPPISDLVLGILSKRYRQNEGGNC